jgi:DNA-binding FadR family transcriptional regulator
MFLEALSASAVPPSEAGKSGGHSDKLAEGVARRLAGEIAELRWPVGKILGSEPALIQRLGVSRAVFREAVRLLEHDGVARMRRGPGGGLVVTAPDARAAARVTALTLEYMEATVQDLFVARSALEIRCIELAAERIDEEGIVMLREVCAKEAEAQSAGQSLGGHDIHRTIAQLSGNPAFVLFLDVLTRLTDHVTSSGERDTGIAPDVRRAHDGIAEAVIAKDAALARHRMQSHLGAMTLWLESSSKRADALIETISA